MPLPFTSGIWQAWAGGGRGQTPRKLKERQMTIACVQDDQALHGTQRLTILPCSRHHRHRKPLPLISSDTALLLYFVLFLPPFVHFVGLVDRRLSFITCNTAPLIFRCVSPCPWQVTVAELRALAAEHPTLLVVAPSTIRAALAAAAADPDEPRTPVQCLLLLVEDPGERTEQDILSSRSCYYHMLEKGRSACCFCLRTQVTCCYMQEWGGRTGHNIFTPLPQDSISVNFYFDRGWQCIQDPNFLCSPASIHQPASSIPRCRRALTESLPTPTARLPACYHLISLKHTV